MEQNHGQKHEKVDRDKADLKALISMIKGLLDPEEGEYHNGLHVYEDHFLPEIRINTLQPCKEGVGELVITTLPKKQCHYSVIEPGFN